MARDKWLTVEIVDEEVRIRIGIDVLAWSAEHNDAYYDAVKYQLKVLDGAGFAKDVLLELEREEEDGTTAVHRLLDKAINAAIDNGSVHCRMEGEEE